MFYSSILPLDDEIQVNIFLCSVVDGKLYRIDYF